MCDFCINLFLCYKKKDLILVNSDMAAKGKRSLRISVLTGGTSVFSCEELCVIAGMIEAAVQCNFRNASIGIPQFLTAFLQSVGVDKINR